LDIGHYLYFRLNNRQQIVRPIYDLKLNGGFAILHKIRRKLNSQRDNIDPLAHRGSLNVGLPFDGSQSAAQEIGLPYHRASLQEPYEYQAPCKPFEPPLYGYILATLLACFIASWGGWLWGGGHRVWGGLLAALGLWLITSTLTTVGFGDPLFWRAGWRLLSGQDPDRRDCQDAEHRQPFQHNGEIVYQKPLTLASLWFTVIDRGLVMANILNTDKQIAVIAALAEGSSIRSIERMTGVHRDTIMRLGVKVGQGCTALMDDKMRDLPCSRLEMDEIWGFIGKKDRHVREGDDPQLGNVWTFCAIDAETKLVPAFRIGQRDAATANAFVRDVASRMTNRVQVSTDGLNAYVGAIEMAFGDDADYGQVIKTYGVETSIQPQRRYSAPEITAIEKKAISGRPNFDLISTSYIERLNATTRLHMKRLARLTHAFSKKRVNFEAAVGLHFAYYNFVKRHSTIRCTPAMAAGVTGSFWSVGDLVEAAA
jgi:IS1 family transposase